MKITPIDYINAVTGGGDFRVKAITNSPGVKKITFVDRKGKSWSKNFKYGV